MLKHFERIDDAELRGRSARIPVWALRRDDPVAQPTTAPEA